MDPALWTTGLYLTLWKDGPHSLTAASDQSASTIHSSETSVSEGRSAGLDLHWYLAV
jgi:hypothetical protein